MIGLQNAGKSSLVNVLTTGSFHEDMIPTVSRPRQGAPVSAVGLLLCHCSPPSPCTHHLPAGLPGVVCVQVGFNMRKVTKGGVTIKMWDLGGQVGLAEYLEARLAADSVCSVLRSAAAPLLPVYTAVTERFIRMHACRHSCSWCQPHCHPAVPMCSHASAAYGRGTAEACRRSCTLWMQQTMKQSR